jgi:hypothetical protein
MPGFNLAQTSVEALELAGVRPRHDRTKVVQGGEQFAADYLLRQKIF